MNIHPFQNRKEKLSFNINTRFKMQNACCVLGRGCLSRMSAQEPLSGPTAPQTLMAPGTQLQAHPGPHAQSRPRLTWHVTATDRETELLRGRELSKL